MEKTTQTELREAIAFMKNNYGTKSRKQKRFREVYQPAVTHILAGERYDNDDIETTTVKSAVKYLGVKPRGTLPAFSVDRLFEKLDIVSDAIPKRETVHTCIARWETYLYESTLPERYCSKV